MNMTDSFARVSRKLARTRFQKFSSAFLRYYPVKNGETTINDFDGNLRIVVNRASYISSVIYWRGHHSLSIVRFLDGFLRPEMTLVDVGANIGEVTLFAAKRLTAGRIWAFEPMPGTFAQLSRNVALNKLSVVQLFNIGLYDRTDSLPVYMKHDAPYGTTNDGVASLFSTGTDRHEPSVPLRRFDDVVSEASIIRVDVMKIDVEGAELMVLRGARASLERFRPVVITELSETNFRRAGYTSSDLLAELHSLDYDVRSLHDAEGKLSLECDAIAFPRELGDSVAGLVPGITKDSIRRRNFGPGRA